MLGLRLFTNMCLKGFIIICVKFDKLLLFEMQLIKW